MKNLSPNFSKFLLSAVFVICCSSFAQAQLTCTSDNVRCPKGMICIDGEQPVCYNMEMVSDSPVPTSCDEINCPMGLACQLNKYGEFICSVKGTDPGSGGEGGDLSYLCKDVLCPAGLICFDGNCIVPGTEPYQNTANKNKSFGDYLTSFLNILK